MTRPPGDLAVWRKLLDLFFRFPTRELTSDERAALEKAPFLRRLSAEEKGRFVKLARRFLDEVEIEGVWHLLPTDEERAWIAASCAILFVNRPEWKFPPVRRVIIAPLKFDEKTRDPCPDGTLDGFFRDKGGYGKGEVWLCRRSLAYSVGDAGDGEHVGVHEFGHSLDAQDGQLDGLPTFLPPALAAPWLDALRKALADTKSGAKALRGYGAGHVRETFAVALESFYERPDALWRQEPTLYSLLADLLKQDPAAFDERERRGVLHRTAVQILRGLVASGSVHEPTSGKLVWQRGRKGCFRRVIFPTRRGYMSIPTCFAKGELDEELRDRMDDEIEVDLDIEKGRPRRIRPKGKAGLRGPPDLSRLKPELAVRCLDASPAECDQAIAVAMKIVMCRGSRAVSAK